MILEKLSLTGESIHQISGEEVKAVPVGDPVLFRIERVGNTHFPSDEEIFRAAPEGADAYSRADGRLLIQPGFAYGFAVQYYKIK